MPSPRDCIRGMLVKAAPASKLQRLWPRRSVGSVEVAQAPPRRPLTGEALGRGPREVRSGGAELLRAPWHAGRRDARGHLPVVGAGGGSMSERSGGLRMMGFSSRGQLGRVGSRRRSAPVTRPPSPSWNSASRQLRSKVCRTRIVATCRSTPGWGPALYSCGRNQSVSEPLWIAQAPQTQ